jgi:hypothetical protein
LCIQQTPIVVSRALQQTRQEKTCWTTSHNHKRIMSFGRGSRRRRKGMGRWNTGTAGMGRCLIFCPWGIQYFRRLYPRGSPCPAAAPPPARVGNHQSTISGDAITAVLVGAGRVCQNSWSVLLLLTSSTSSCKFFSIATYLYVCW